MDFGGIWGYGTELVKEVRFGLGFRSRRQVWQMTRKSSGAVPM